MRKMPLPHTYDIYISDNFGIYVLIMCIKRRREDRYERTQNRFSIENQVAMYIA